MEGFFMKRKPRRDLEYQIIPFDFIRISNYVLPESKLFSNYRLELFFMKKEMKIVGVAPLIAIPTLLYLILTVVINFLTDGMFTITKNGYPVLAVTGVVLIIAGVLMVISCGRRLLKSFDNGLLMTDGLYRIFRNPMYAAYLLFVIPGICMLFNSWLVLTTLIVNYILFSIFIKREHRYLEEKFGSEYDNYLEKVFIKFL
jgi:protein-S-isoprenylcysteine O-methyltransferase Ste14